MTFKPQPKPRPRIVDRIAVRKERERKAQDFRVAIWLRDQGRCQVCYRKVIHTLELVPNAGHVHHRRGRNVAPGDRYVVHEAVLLCRRCHADPDVVLKLRRPA